MKLTMDFPWNAVSHEKNYNITNKFYKKKTVLHKQGLRNNEYK